MIRLFLPSNSNVRCPAALIWQKYASQYRAVNASSSSATLWLHPIRRCKSRPSVLPLETPELLTKASIAWRLTKQISELFCTISMATREKLNTSGHHSFLRLQQDLSPSLTHFKQKFLPCQGKLHPQSINSSCSTKPNLRDP